jgi:hypothetical protein
VKTGIEREEQRMGFLLMSFGEKTDPSSRGGLFFDPLYLKIWIC